MLTHQGCPQTPGGRIRALGFARMGARGRRRGPIPAVCHRYSSPVLDVGRTGPRSRGPRIGAVSASGRVGITSFFIPDAGFFPTLRSGRLRFAVS